MWCVPVQIRGEGGVFCYRGLQDIGASSVAKQEVAARPGDLPIRRRSRGWRPVCSGEHGGVDLGCTKMTRFVKKVFKATGMQIGRAHV